MRMVGPDSVGVPEHPGQAQCDVHNTMPASGQMAFASQSAPLGVAALDLAAERSVGVSSFVSLGDRADLSSNDFCSNWEADPDTDAILLYLESFANPQHFGQVARRVARTKPLIALMSHHTRAVPPGSF
jgi:acyl-CoA synthetase (NDP forming)